jgi:hypothetical protein
VLARRYYEVERVQYFCTGEIVATIKNLFLEEGQEPLTPWDFVPGGEPKDEGDEDINDDDEVNLAIARAQVFAIQWNTRLKMKEDFFS